MSDKLQWICPACETHNDDDIHPVDGPFITCTCDECGQSFDQDRVPKVA